MAYVYIRTLKSTGRYVALAYVKESSTEDKRQVAIKRNLR